MESGTVLTCYEDSVGPTKPSYLMAKYACNYTDEMWNSGNFTALKDCLMKMDVQDGINFSQVEKVKLIGPNLNLASLRIPESCLLEYGSG